MIDKEIKNSELLLQPTTGPILKQIILKKCLLEKAFEITNMPTGCKMMFEQ